MVSATFAKPIKLELLVHSEMAVGGLFWYLGRF